MPDLLYSDDTVVEALNPDAAVRLADLFKALADPTRVRIVGVLLDGELPVGVIAEAVGMSASAVSHQLRSLRQLNLVKFRRDGRHIYYTLDDAHVRDLFEQSLLHVTHG
jgi:ArsR family transcriptional regulator